LNAPGDHQIVASSENSDSKEQDLGDLYKQIEEEWSGPGRHEGLYVISMDEAGGDLLEARLIYARKRLLQITQPDV
jgi:hypothetical protein